MGIHKIKGVVQHYAWGGRNFIPSLLGYKAKGDLPFAEYWLGTHPSHPSVLEDGTSLLTFPGENANISCENRQGAGLPYLFKILDVNSMLSIQVHPNKAGAEKGYEKEEKLGIPLSSPQRNYRDRNHKPEMMVALDDFYLLHGFRSPEQISELLNAIPGWQLLLPAFENGSYRGLYEFVMRMPEEQLNGLLAPLAERLVPRYKKNLLQKESADYWAAKAFLEFCKNNRFDRGIFSIYFFNLIKLRRGEGIFQDHGIPHAYLEGRNVEVMANSDNVLRGGLTEKHVDIEELLLHTKFEAVDPQIISAGKEKHHLYKPGVKEFELHHYEEEQTTSIHAGAGEIYWVEKQTLEIISGSRKISAGRGEAVFISSAQQLELHMVPGSSVFRVLIPGG